MNKTVRNLERCKDCGDGKFVDEKCKCLKPQPQKESRYKIPCQFCGSMEGREWNWKLRKITCLNCKNIFRIENAKRRFRGKETLKWTQSNYKKLVLLHSSALPN